MTALTDDYDDDSSVGVWTRFDENRFPRLAKMAAVRRAFNACIDEGLPDEFAAALAQAAVDPARLRAAVKTATTLPVPGGVVHVIDLDLWVPGVVPMPTNNRTLEHRIYPTAGAAGHSGPLSGPRSDSGETSTLVVEADSVEHVLHETQRARDYILGANPLRTSIAGRGILMPVDVVYVVIEHRNGQPAAGVLATAEGSSRVTNAQDILGLEDQRLTHYDFLADGDAFRRFVNAIADEDAADDLSPREMRRLLERRNALVVPARVFLRFEPADGSRYDYARAMYGYLGTLHVDPPRPWTPVGRREAMAEAVLRVLQAEDPAMRSPRYEYLAGFLSPDEARAHGFPVERDRQAAYVLAELLRPERAEMVDRGIRDVTAARSVSLGRRADVVAELALRPTRSAALVADDADARHRAASMRAAYLRATRMRAYSQYPWTVTDRSLEQLRDAALKEVRDAAAGRDARWASRLELAAIAQYHLTAYGALRREPLGGGGRADVDQRGPHDIIAAMIRDTQGIQVLHQAIIDGRAGRLPRLVDAGGDPVHGTYGEDGIVVDLAQPEMAVTDEILRYELYPPSGTRLNRRPVPLNETPTMAVTRLQGEVALYVDRLSDVIDELRRPVGPSGRSIIDDEGWHARPLAGQLSDVQNALVSWSFIAERSASRAEDDEDEHVESSEWDDEE